MPPLLTFPRFNSRQSLPDDAVQVVIFVSDGHAVADVIWHANELSDGGDYFYPTIVPLALERARDVCENYNFSEVVIILDDLALWDPAWGDLSG